MPPAPNIVYIFTDQQWAGAMSCAGNAHVHTPALDRLAARGVRFGNAYCAYPLCVPSRMSMVTGRLPHELGIFANCPETEAPCLVPTLGNCFRAAGYETCWIGKWHLTIPESQAATHGFERIVFGGGYGDLDSKKTAAAVTFLEQGHDRPFLLVVSFNNPHDCCEWSRRQELKMAPLPEPTAADDLPPLPPNYAVPDHEPDYLRTFARQHPRTFPSTQWDEMAARRYLWGYYRLVEMVDREIGRVLAAVDDAGLGPHTLVVFASDHGDGAARHHWNQKWSLYDESAKVPFIMAGAGVDAPGRVDDRPVAAGLDLLPTFCAAAGIAAPADLPGCNLLDTDALDRRDYVVSELSFSMWEPVGEDHWPKARMVRSRRYKYTAYDAGDIREQLVDLQDDPDETVNLATSPAHRDILRQHRQYLADWCAHTADTFQPTP